jgi:hypothetical protein
MEFEPRTVSGCDGSGTTAPKVKEAGFELGFKPYLIKQKKKKKKKKKKKALLSLHTVSAKPFDR